MSLNCPQTDWNSPMLSRASCTAPTCNDFQNVYKWGPIFEGNKDPMGIFSSRNGDPKNINEYIRTCARHINDWDEIEFPSSFTSEQRKNVHVSVQRLSVQRNSVLISTMSRTIGNERMVYLVKGKDANVSKFGGIDVSTLLRQKIFQTYLFMWDDNIQSGIIILAHNDFTCT